MLVESRVRPAGMHTTAVPSGDMSQGTMPVSSTSAPKDLAVFKSQASKRGPRRPPRSSRLVETTTNRPRCDRKRTRQLFLLEVPVDGGLGPDRNITVRM